MNTLNAIANAILACHGRHWLVPNRTTVSAVRADICSIICLVIEDCLYLEYTCNDFPVRPNFYDHSSRSIKCDLLSQAINGLLR